MTTTPPAFPQKKESLIERVGALYKLLEAAFPTRRSKQGHLDIANLAKEMGYSHETLYRCVRSNVIKTTVALAIIRHSHADADGRKLYWEDLLPFILPAYLDYSDPDRRAAI
jgi:hypothetical protein